MIADEVLDLPEFPGVLFALSVEFDRVACLRLVDVPDSMEHAETKQAWHAGAGEGRRA